MKKKRRRSGRYRFIIIMIILAAAVVVVFRAASGHRKKNPETEAASSESGVNMTSDGGNTAAISAAAVGISGDSAAGAQDTAAPASGGAAGNATQSSASGAAGNATQSSASGAAGDATQPAASGAAGNATQSSASGAAGNATQSSASSSQTASGKADDHVVTETEAGKAYLESLDDRSPAEMEYEIDLKKEEYEKEKERKAYLEKREKYRQDLEKDGVWDRFEDYVFLGDSRVVGFNVFGFLPEERILAQAGDTILAISDRMDSIKALDPRYIFISYGINDVGIGFWQTAEEYEAAFSEKIEELQKELPDAQIYVNSVIPATDEAVSGMSVWGKTPEFSEAMRRICLKKKIPFIDNASLIEEHSELYAGDGVHLQAEFYIFWAENQLLGIYDRKNGRTSDGNKITFPATP